MLGKIRSKSADSRKSGMSRSESQEFIGGAFGEAEERIRALGEVTSHLDKKEVSGEVLDQAIRNLFDKYSTYSLALQYKQHTQYNSYIKELLHSLYMFYLVKRPQ